eukprot:gene20810-21518_t
MSCDISCETLSIVTDNVNVVLAVITAPTGNSSSGSTGGGLAFVTVPDLASSNNSVSIGVATGGSPIVASVVVYNQQLWTGGSNASSSGGGGGSGSSTTAIYSDVVSVTVVAVSNGSSTATLPVFVANLSSSVGSSAAVNVQVFRHNCTKGRVEAVSFLCAAAKIYFNLTCSGLADAVLSRRCPVPEQQCSIVDLSTRSVQSNRYCQVGAVVNNVVSCRCGGSAAQNGSALGSGAAVSLAITVQYSSGTIAGAFSVASASLTADIAEQSSLLFIAFGGLWAAAIVLVGAHYQRRRRQASRRAVAKVAALSVGVGVGEKAGGEAGRFAQCFESFVARLLPEVFRRQSVLQRLWLSLQRQLLVKLVRTAFFASPARRPGGGDDEA